MGEQDREEAKPLEPVSDVQGFFLSTAANSPTASVPPGTHRIYDFSISDIAADAGQRRQRRLRSCSH